MPLRAWAPVFVSLEKVFAPELYAFWYPNGWEVSQKEAVEGVCTAEGAHVWVAGQGPFLDGKLHYNGRLGENLTVEDGRACARIVARSGSESESRPEP